MKRIDIIKEKMSIERFNLTDSNMISNDIYGALQLLVVGMVTVFLVLVIVINLGKLLIWAVNKWAPEETVAKKAAPAAKAIASIDATTGRNIRIIRKEELRSDFSLMLYMMPVIHVLNSISPSISLCL